MMSNIISIKYPVGIDKGLGTLTEELNYEQHVVQLIKQVLFTNPGERINRPDFGCGLRRMIFAPNSDVTASLLQTTVYQALETWLSSVLKVERVQVNVLEEKLEVEIVYILKARQQRRFLNLEIQI
ncbi:MAG: GPW/gp25 family protein [Chitinophagales bacterium]|nr:GPW/gp25 family protein [Chitinophagales bacterium]